MMDTLRPDIFKHFLLQYRGFTHLEVKNILVTSVGTVLIMEVFSSCVLNSEHLFREVPLYTYYCIPSTRNL